MKNFRRYMFRFVVLFVLIGGYITSVQAAASLGTFCWTNDDGGFIKLFLIDTGAGDFLANGRVEDPGHDPEPLIGSGFADGGNVIFTLTGTGADSSGFKEAYTERVVLSLSTLNGNSDIFSFEREGTDPPGLVSIFHGTHTWTNISCTLQ